MKDEPVLPGYKNEYRTLTLMSVDWLVDEQLARQRAPHLMTFVDELARSLQMDPIHIQLNNYAPRTMTQFHEDTTIKERRKVFCVGLDGEGNFLLTALGSPKDPAESGFKLAECIPLQPGDAVAMTMRKAESQYMTRTHAGINDSNDFRTVLILMFGKPEARESLAA